MSSEALKEFIKSRPSIFWWTLLNVLAAAFAIASWSICLYLFNFPERPANYEILRKIKRITPVESYDPLGAPDGDSAEPPELLKKFYSLSPDQLTAHNRHFKRNYLTNFRKPVVVSYVEGTFRVTGTRPLTKDDFFHPGVVIRAQATVRGEDVSEPNLYPVIIELMLPLEEDPPESLFPAGHDLQFRKLDHRALILHAARLGNENSPSVCLTLVPLAFPNYLKPDGTPIPLAAPDPLNLKATFPVMDENRPE